MSFVRFTDVLPDDHEVNSTCEFNQDFWDSINKINDCNAKSFTRVICNIKDFAVYAYLSEDISIEEDTAINYLLSADSIFYTFKDMYPDLQVICLHGYNEYADKLLRLIKKCNIEYRCIGRLWKIAGEEPSYGADDYPDYSVLNIYCEGTGSYVDYHKCVIHNFAIVNKLAYENSRIILENNINRLSTADTNISMCVIPQYSNVKYFTEDEKFYRKYGKNYTYILNEPKVNELEYEALYKVFDREDIKDLMDLHTQFDSRNKYKINFGLPAITVKNLDNQIRIYIIGPCIVSGFAVSTKYTMLSVIQDLVDKEYKDQYCVIGITVGETNFSAYRKALETITLRQKDIVLLVVGEEIAPCIDQNICRTVSLDNLINDPYRKTYFADSTMHTNREGNNAYANAIYHDLLEEQLAVSQSYQDNKCLQLTKKLSKNDEVLLNNYIDKVKEMLPSDYSDNEQSGAIVMNCNPFTKGHRYLIEKSAKKVKWLFVFVVEEDRSYFKFEDRIRLVREGIKDIKNVIVVPSGQFILSFNTLPVYFEKSVKQDYVVDASSDIEIFSQYIAPKLHIGIRFVGEEPFDKVTNQYNRQMKVILEQYGIGFCEIERLKSDSKVISATVVRKMIQEKRINEIREFVPDNTYDFICSEMFKGKYLNGEL